MNNHTADIFGTMYHPHSTLVIYKTKGSNKNTYVEHFDMDANGNPVNAHPLTVREAQVLGKALNTRQATNTAFLQPNGILPTTVLYLDRSDNGYAIWYTKPQKRQLFFVKSLGIPNGTAHIPTLLWKATKNSLSVFALRGTRRPTEHTPLYYAPFFNIYQSGSICMGTVTTKAHQAQSLEDFIHTWETHFFNSYFSHLLDDYNPIKGNCVSLWKNRINTDKPFPKGELKKNGKTLKDLIP